MDFKIDPSTGDIDITGNYVSGIERAAQRIDILINTMRGEWFWNKSRGIPYFQDVLGKKSKATVDSIFIEAILAEDYVESIVNFSSVIEKRTYIPTFTIKTVEGLINTI
jgi:hypothetical protein